MENLLNFENENKKNKKNQKKIISSSEEKKIIKNLELIGILPSPETRKCRACKSSINFNLIIDLIDLITYDKLNLSRPELLVLLVGQISMNVYYRSLFEQAIPIILVMNTKRILN